MDPFLAWVVKQWNTWNARSLVLLSLALQVLITILGSRRKYITGNWIKFILWSAYLMADKVAIVSLAKLLEISNNDPHKDIMFPNSTVIRALWAPILLMHLGGPDTITAYSLEDNHLWQRYLLGLAVQAGVAVYVIYSSWTRSWPFTLTLPLFLAGIIKFGERTWALKYLIAYEDFIELRSRHLSLENLKKHLESDATTYRGLELLNVAYVLFNDLKSHILKLVRRRSRPWNYSLIFSLADISVEDYFKMKEFELGFIYDVLYTKATVIHTLTGSSLRFICCLSIVSGLWGFSIAEKPVNAEKDIDITYVLLIGAVVLEIYAIILVVYSDWAILWMIKNHNRWLVTGLLRFVAPRSVSKRRRWSDSMGQFNLLSYCLNDKPRKFSRILKFFSMDPEFKMLSRILQFFDIEGEFLIKYKRVKFPEDLKKLILQMIRDVQRERAREEECLFPDGGKWALKRYNIDWIPPHDEDFKKSIVMWHIATDICYYSNDLNNSTNSQSTESANLSKLLSDYMLYLLVMCPDKLSFTDSPQPDLWKKACNEVEGKLAGRASISEEELCKILTREEPSNTSMGDFRGLMGINVLEDAHILAKALMGKENKWKAISNVWVEILCHVATNCHVYYQAQQLSQGGELITFVWLLLLPLAEFSEREVYTV